MARLPCNLVAMKVQHCNKVFLCGCNATFLKCCIVIAKRFPSVVAMQPFCNENAMLQKPFCNLFFPLGRYLDWLSVYIILKAKSPSVGRSGLELALNERPGLQHSFEPSFESLRRKTRLLLHINHIYEGPKITPLQGHSLAYEQCLPKNIVGPKITPLQGHSLAYEQGHFSHLKGAFFPFEGVHLRHLDWLFVNIILEAKSPSACRRRLGQVLN